MSNAWESMLTYLEPKYPQYEHFMKSGKLVHSLTSMPGGWVFSIYKDWMSNYLDPHVVAERSTWVTNNLQNWDNVLQLDSTHWMFSQKDSADKFLTFYSLSWTL